MLACFILAMLMSSLALLLTDTTVVSEFVLLSKWTVFKWNEMSWPRDGLQNCQKINSIWKVNICVQILWSFFKKKIIYNHITSHWNIGSVMLTSDCWRPFKRSTFLSAFYVNNHRIHDQQYWVVAWMVLGRTIWTTNC